MHQPSEHDYHCLKHILRYIFGTLGRGLLIRPRDLELRGFSDSDWANDKNDRKSTSGFLVFWRLTWSPGVPKNNPRSLGPRLKLNTAPLLFLLLRPCGSHIFFTNSAPLTLFLLSIVTTNQPSVWPRIPSYTPEWIMLIPIVSLFAMKFRPAPWLCSMNPLKNNRLIFSPSLSRADITITSVPSFRSLPLSSAWGGIITDSIK